MGEHVRVSLSKTPSGKWVAYNKSSRESWSADNKTSLERSVKTAINSNRCHRRKGVWIFDVSAVSST